MASVEPRRGRSTTHRLTIPGLISLGLVLTIAADRSNPSVDPEITALVMVAMITLMVVGVLAPMVAMARVRVRLTCPADAVVGDKVPVTVILQGRVDRASVRLLDPPGEWHRTDVPNTGVVEHLARQRGVFHQVAVEVRTSWPVGLYTSGRTHYVRLPQPIQIAPRPLPVAFEPRVLPAEATNATGAINPGVGDAVRTVRPYQVGDPPRLVHWPSTARSGDLVVRELEPPVRTGIAVVLDLGTEPDAPAAQGGPGGPGLQSGRGRPATIIRQAPVASAPAGPDPRVERAAARAAGLVAAALRAGSEVILCTHEIDGPQVGVVTNMVTAGRRLARATPGPVPPTPDGWPFEVVAP